MQKKTSISGDKVKEILIDGINQGANYILNKSSFYEHVRTIHKMEKQRCLRLYDLYYPDAQKKRNSLKTEIGAKEEIKSVKWDIMKRNEGMAILSDVARGKAKRVDGVIVMPSFAERTKAIDSLAKIDGWNSPAKVEQSITFEQPLFPDEK